LFSQWLHASLCSTSQLFLASAKLLTFSLLLAKLINFSPILPVYPVFPPYANFSCFFKLMLVISPSPHFCQTYSLSPHISFDSAPPFRSYANLFTFSFPSAPLSLSLPFFFFSFSLLSNFSFFSFSRLHPKPTLMPSSLSFLPFLRFCPPPFPPFFLPFRPSPFFPFPPLPLPFFPYPQPYSLFPFKPILFYILFPYLFLFFQPALLHKPSLPLNAPSFFPPPLFLPPYPCAFLPLLRAFKPPFPPYAPFIFSSLTYIQSLPFLPLPLNLPLLLRLSPLPPLMSPSARLSAFAPLMPNFSNFSQLLPKIYPLFSYYAHL